MEKILWYLFMGMRGGENRIRIINDLLETPRNTNQLANKLDLDYKTIQHHLDMLENHDIVESSGKGYGDIYLLTDNFKNYQEEFNKIKNTVEKNNKK